jgi:hypothetical protein
MRTVSLFVAAAAALATSVSVAAAPISVSPGGELADLGLFAAGTYQLTGAGLLDLGDNVGIRPDGTPTAPLPAPYEYFNPDGAYTDVLLGNATGRAGFNAKLGALVGTLNAAAYTGNSPTLAQANDWFLIGFGRTITLTSAQHIYAALNDTYYSNNTGTFTVSVSAVPEPSSVMLVLGGVAVLWGARLRSKSVA